MPPSSDLELRDRLEMLWRRKMIVIATVVVTVGVALAVSYAQSPVYEAKSTILFQRQASDLVLESGQSAPAANERAVNTELQVLRSQAVVDFAEEAVGRRIDVSAGVLGGSDVLEVRARNGSPEQAAADADAYAQAYVDLRRLQAVEDLDAATQQVAARIEDIDLRLAVLPEEAESQRPGLEALRDLYARQLEQLQLAAGLASGPTVLTAAEPPTAPASPRPIRNAALAFGIGLVLGLGLAFLRDHLDDSVKSKDELERVTETPVLALIPAIDSSDVRPSAVADATPGSVLAEAFRTLRTSVQFLSLDHPVRRLQITSVNASESKTTTVANLGVALARAGTSVVMVSCDLRRPTLHELFDVPNEIGLTSVFLDEVTLPEVVQSVQGESHLSLITSGPLPANPSELLASKRMLELLESLQERYAIVLLDSPPVLPVADAMVVSGIVDATLMIARAGVTSRDDARHAVETLRQVGAPLVGTILSGVTGTGYGRAGAYSGRAVYTSSAASADGSPTRTRTAPERGRS